MTCYQKKEKSEEEGVPIISVLYTAAGMCCGVVVVLLPRFLLLFMEILISY